MAIESLYTDRLHEFYEILGFHYEKAENWEKAAEYLGRSGNKAKQIYTTDESEDFFQRKEEAIQKLYESQSRKAQFLGNRLDPNPPADCHAIPLVPIYWYVFMLGKKTFLFNEQTLLTGSGVSVSLLWYAPLPCGSWEWYFSCAVAPRFMISWKIRSGSYSRMDRRFPSISRIYTVSVLWTGKLKNHDRS